jgi:hypothetical protein
MVSVTSPTYPYERVQDYLQMPRLEELPKMIVNYLCDFPSAGYTPPDNNKYPRARLMKYLYYDTANPLSNALPTAKQKLNLIYDPFNPTNPPDAERGYRIYPLIYPIQSQLKAQTQMRVYVGRIIPVDVFKAQVSIVIDILCNALYDTNTKTSAMSRSVAMEQCLWEALSGVNMLGVGTFYGDRRQMTDCGSKTITDEKQNVGRSVTFGLTIMGEEKPFNTIMS